MSDDAQITTTPAPFFYWQTDSNPPKGAKGFKLTTNNVSPALALWLLMTTNPQWVHIFAQGKIDAALSDLPTIAAAAGLTPNSTQWIFDLLRKDASTTAAFYTVALVFQSFKGTASDPNSYQPSFCPSLLEEIMRFNPASLVKNIANFEVGP